MFFYITINPLFNMQKKKEKTIVNYFKLRKHTRTKNKLKNSPDQKQTQDLYLDLLLLKCLRYNMGCLKYEIFFKIICTWFFVL